MYDIQSITESMKQLGFSEYECKTYFTLLEEFPLTGYTLSKHSGVPRSRIYDVLESLIAKQVVFLEEEEKNRLYFPVEPDIFLKRLKTRFDKVFSDVSEYTKDLYKNKKQDDNLVVIKGRKNIIDFLNLLIKKAEQRISMSVWDEELQEITCELKNARKRGIILKGIYFGENNPFEELVPHRRLKRYRAEKKERYMSIIIDSTHSISGIVSRGEDSKVTWTRDEGIIEISEDYIAHDLVVNLYSASLKGKAYEDFEKFADNSHKEYFGFTDEDLAAYRSVE